jgi:hypothetical protein
MYKIVRFYRDDEERNGEVIQTGLTKEEAQEHCYNPATRGDGWFDGWTEDN